MINIQATNFKTNESILMVAFYSSNNFSSFISGVSPNSQPIVIRIPKDAKYVVFGSNTSGAGQYTELNAPIEIQGLMFRADANTFDVVSLACPSKYDLVVGDTFELFYKGIIKSFNDSAFCVIANCSIGYNFEKKFMTTPTTAGSYTLTLDLFDSNMQKIDSKEISLVVHAAPTSPASMKNILCVGDSLTSSGQWVVELARRLTASGGTPAGFNLSNINFIGTCEADGIKYEGYGGYTFEKYNTNTTSASDKVITCTSDKTEAEDQHSIYQDGAGNTWKLETITDDSIKIILQSGTASTIPASGTMTWVSGGVHHSNITYTAVSNVVGNPFWDNNQNKVDFGVYATSQGVSSIDYVLVLLGWNNWGRTMEYIKTQAQTFINNVLASFPNAKIILSGMEIPSRNGLGNNYGALTFVSDYTKMMNFVFDVDNAYDELANNNTNVYHINLSGQFDTEHNMPESTRAVNIRNAETEVYQTNGIHPALSGQMQIADAMARCMVGLL